MTESNSFSIETERGNRLFRCDIACDSESIGNNNRDFKKMRSKLEKLTKKYGWSGFRLEVAEINENLKKSIILGTHVIESLPPNRPLNNSEEGNIPKSDISRKKKIGRPSKPVLKCDRKGRLLAEYFSISEASRQTGVGTYRISRCCKGVDGFLTAGGFVWKYKDDSPDNPKPKKPYIEKGILQYDLEGKLIAEWPSETMAAKSLRLNVASLSNCVNGKYKTCGGYIWARKEGKKIKKTLSSKELKIRVTRLRKPVLQYDKQGILLKEYPSTEEASFQTGINRSSLTKCCEGSHKTAGGYVWKYKRCA